MTGNRVVIALHEVFFLAIYALVLRPPSNLLADIKKKPTPYLVAIAWIVSISISLIWSPLGMGEEFLGLVRYFLTLLHILFFFFVRDFLIRYPVPVHRPSAQRQVQLPRQRRLDDFFKIVIFRLPA